MGGSVRGGAENSGRCVGARGNRGGGHRESEHSVRGTAKQSWGT